MEEGIAPEEVKQYIDSFLENIESMKERIRGTDYKKLQENVYHCISNTCSIVSAYIDGKGEKGWSSQLKYSNGTPVFTKEDQEDVESSFELAGPWLLPFLTEEEE